MIKQKLFHIPFLKFFVKTTRFHDCKTCSHCGQNTLPFKKGICPGCSRQVWNIQYVKNPKEYVKSNYGTIKTNETKKEYQKVCGVGDFRQDVI